MDYVHEYISSKPFYDKNIDVLFPKMLGKFELTNIVDNEKQSTGSGVSLEYTYCESYVTITVYNKTNRSLENGIVSEIILAEMDNSIEELHHRDKAGEYSKVNLCQPKNITYDICKSRITFRCAIANYESKSEEKTSLIMLCGFNKNIIKILYTTNKSLFIYTTEGEKLFDGFMGSLCNILCG
jgi:hypothetical protein